MKELYNTKKVKNKLIKKYLLVIIALGIVFTIINLFVVLNIVTVYILLIFVISLALIIIFKLYSNKQVQYVCFVFLIFLIFYFGAHKRLSFINIFYVNIVLAIVFIYELKKDTIKIVSLLSLVVVAIFINLFTNVFKQGKDLTTTQINIIFTVEILFIFIFFYINLLFILKSNNALEWYLKEYHKIIDNKRVVDKVSLEEINKLKEELFEDYKGFLISFQNIFPQFYSRVKKINNISLSEIELLALLKLNFTTNEITQITNSTHKSIESKKYRIRKKFNIPTSEDLYIWIDNI